MATGREDNIAAVESIKKSSTSRAINKKLDLLDQKMDKLYKDIYISRPDNKQNLDLMIDNLDSVIDKLQGADTTVAGMSELLRRVDKSDSDNTKKLMSSVQDLFNDQNIIGSLAVNDQIHNYIAGQNRNYDLICKYLPKLQDALEIKRDNVLCSDNFSKRFINPKSVRSSKEESEIFNNNVEKLEKEYDISEFLDKTYMNTSKYGEDFIYIVPYKTGFERLFTRSQHRYNTGRLGQVTLFEGYSEEVCLRKNYGQTKEFTSYVEDIKYMLMNEDGSTSDPMKDMPELGSVTLHFNDTNMMNRPVHEKCVLRTKQDLEQFMSLTEAYGLGFHDSAAQAVNEANKTSSMFDGIQKQHNKLLNHKSGYDGLIINNNLVDRNPDELDSDFLGAIVERIPRENILPIYMGKKCLGYYYFEFAEDPNACGFCGGHHSTPMLSNASKQMHNMSEYQQELTIRYISSRISQAIDTKFINANKDLKEEIYSILRYNDKFDISRSNDIGVTFIPAEDIVHTYFELDENTHRGISDLDRALTPAMLYILLYLTDIISKITRSTDKRVYYVKQNVETNVARTMMNVVNQIKKGNLGMRQIESMNNILNIVGKYNDYIIPVGASGDSPVQFEVMSGQNIETPTDIMEKMEESAVNTIIPFEFVNSTYQQDFATRFTMSNTRFLKSIYTRQRKTQKFFSKIYTRIYNYEYGDNIYMIDVILPPPTYLTMTNNSQLIDNINSMAEKIIEAELTDEEDEIKNEFKRLYLRENLGTYIDYVAVNRLIETSKVNVEAKKVPSVDENDDVNSVMDDDL